MKTLFTRFALVAVLSTPFVAVTSLAQGQGVDKAIAPSPEATTVVVQVSLSPGARPEAVAAAMNDMRALVRKQPGFLGEEFVQNINAANNPRYVHVVHWASMSYWEGVFTSPEFARISAAGAGQYTILASAFRPVK